MTRTTPFSNRTTSVSLFSGRYWSVGVPIRCGGESIADYSPFGVLPIAIGIDGRTISMESYRYSFNGMLNDTWISGIGSLSGVNPEWSLGRTSGEKDDEVKGGGNSYDFGARMYDSRVGRFLSLDRLNDCISYVSPFAFCKNTPTYFKDNDGNIWVNPYYLAIVNELLLSNPDFSKIERLKCLAFENQLVIDEIKKNDPELFSYIENLTYKESQVSVFVFISRDEKSSSGADAVTEFAITKQKKGKYKIKGFDNNNNIEGKSDGIKASTQENTVNVILFGSDVNQELDVKLANEASDVICLYEHIKHTYDQAIIGQKNNWKYEEYNNTQFSFIVDKIYQVRKSGTEMVEDAYPLKIVEIGKIYRTNNDSKSEGYEFKIN